MPIFAVVSGNTVINTINALTVEDAQSVTNAECIEISQDNPAGIGWLYDETTGRFTRPEGQ